MVCTGLKPAEGAFPPGCGPGGGTLGVGWIGAGEGDGRDLSCSILPFGIRSWPSTF